jgi:hypothetical protein
MPALEMRARFLLRGSALLAGLLILWWFALAGPMLFLLRYAAGCFVDIRDNPSGDWTLHVPFEAMAPGTPGQPAPQQIHSVDFDIPRSDVNGFYFQPSGLLGDNPGRRWAAKPASPAAGHCLDGRIRTGIAADFLPDHRA